MEITNVAGNLKRIKKNCGNGTGKVNVEFGGYQFYGGRGDPSGIESL